LEARNRSLPRWRIYFLKQKKSLTFKSSSKTKYENIHCHIVDCLCCSNCRNNLLFESPKSSFNSRAPTGGRIIGAANAARKIITPKPESPDKVLENTNTMAQMPATNPVAQIPSTNSVVQNLQPDDSTSSIRKLVDTLLATKTDKKEALFAQLRKAGNWMR